MLTRSIIAVLVLAGVALAAWAASERWQHAPQRAALAAFCAEMPAGHAGYPQRGAALRARAWLSAAPSQPEGVDIFVDLQDAVLSPERQVTPSDLREAVRRIRGLTWDAAAAAWRGGGRPVPLAEIRALLVAALPTATDAEAVIDLMTGVPGQGLPDVRDIIIADPPRLKVLRIVPFSGSRGRLLLDRGKASYLQTERGYSGLLLSMDAVGIDPAWRILRLRAAAP